jgi:multisubunit Na+/H+ antiporter MnhE subunit
MTNDLCILFWEISTQTLSILNWIAGVVITVLVLNCFNLLYILEINPCLNESFVSIYPIL